MTKEYDPVQEYLRERGCPAHVVKMGLKGLVMSWEKVVAELVFDGYRYGLRDFVHDLDRREILAGALARLAETAGAPGSGIPATFQNRVTAADARFSDASWAASRCLVDEPEAGQRGLSRAHHAWYYRVPRRHRANFAKDLKEAGITTAAAPTDGEGGMPPSDA